MAWTRRYVQHCQFARSWRESAIADHQNLVEKVIRARIYDSLYWKEHCFALNGELMSFPYY